MDARLGARRVRLECGGNHYAWARATIAAGLELRVTRASRRAGRGIPWFVLAGVLVAALSMRGPIVAPTPVLRDIEGLRIGSATAGC